MSSDWYEPTVTVPPDSPVGLSSPQATRLLTATPPRAPCKSVRRPKCGIGMVRVDMWCSSLRCGLGPLPLMCCALAARSCLATVSSSWLTAVANDQMRVEHAIARILIGKGGEQHVDCCAADLSYGLVNR